MTPSVSNKNSNDPGGLTIEVWSDVVCPWCYIGKRRLETALSRFARQDLVTVVWRSYQLNPAAPKTTDEPTRVMLARKYGVSLEQADAMQARVTGVAAGEGLRYRLELTKPENTFDAHRLLHFAQTRGLQDELKERLFAGYFTEGASLGDTDTLIELAVNAGLDKQAVVDVLSRGEYADGVADDARRAREFGIQGVPFFVVTGPAGARGVSGAQPADVILQALQEASQESE